MAGGETVELAGYSFSVRPWSALRRWTGDFFPYWQSDKPRFTLTITRTGVPIGKQTITWMIRFSNADETGGFITVPALQQGNL